MFPLTDTATLIPHTCSLAWVKHFLTLLDSWGTKEFVCLPLFKCVMNQLMILEKYTSTQAIHVTVLNNLRQQFDSEFHSEKIFISISTQYLKDNENK